MAGTAGPTSSGGSGEAPAESPSAELEELRRRIARIEQLTKLLETRVAALERYLSPRAENPSDAAATRQKVTYDWQS